VAPTSAASSHKRPACGCRGHSPSPLQVAWPLVGAIVVVQPPGPQAVALIGGSPDHGGVPLVAWPPLQRAWPRMAALASGRCNRPYSGSGCPCLWATAIALGRAVPLPTSDLPASVVVVVHSHLARKQLPWQ
ncbi:hypothetical protein BHE74_00057508, partial [Ensete ventricosum]